MATARRSGAAALPVRPGEKPWTGAELDKVRAELEAEVAGLRADIDQAESADRGAARRRGRRTPGTTRRTRAPRRSSASTTLPSPRTPANCLTSAQHALARIDDGSYGVCASCGQPIGKARLQAFPRATLCVACKQREERR